MWDVLLCFMTGIALGRILRPGARIGRIIPYIAYTLIFLIGL